MTSEHGIGCPTCGTDDGRVFHRVARAPVHSVRLLRDRAAALAFPTGSLALAFCPACGLVWNADFDPAAIDYGVDYEETQGFSGTFSAFHRRLAEDLVARHGLAGRHVVEVGCGKGEFLSLLCELGAARGTGIDPAYLPERNRSPARDRIEVLRETLSERHGDLAGDFVCCKMTLEHIDRPAAFIGLLRGTLAAGDGPVVFVQVPESLRILRQGAFWDVYYEHCCYFAPASLARLLTGAGFEVLRVWTDYDDQYLMAEARPDGAGSAAGEGGLEALAAAVAGFGAHSAALKAAWRGFFARQREAGCRVALWGGGSKAVAFLTTLGLGPEIDCVVDINPHKQGCYLPASGHEVVAPEALRARAPETVVIMNPVYREEIEARLAGLGLRPALHAVDAPPRAGDGA